MAEEHGCQSPKGHRLCENNCGFFGSPATQNMCSKCYGEVCLKNSFPPKQQSTSSSSSIATSPSILSTKEIESPLVKEKESSLSSSSCVNSNNPTRCFCCRKKVGLTGFKCKCGTTFCGTHRYPEKHGCTFDFKAVGREAIARENPLVKGEKLNNRI